MAGNQFTVAGYGMPRQNRQTGQSGFNPYAAGDKHYGAGRNFPTSGTVNRQGYAERDNMVRARRNAMLQRLQQEQAGNYNHPSVLRPRSY